ncbi:MAG TPA: lipopolysaccharide core heptose(I) kinase RfaP [Methylotenera sp.]|nr:lipopolysaccharide core heptose(I) kinase RfaP [Methylotenera sp.]
MTRFSNYSHIPAKLQSELIGTDPFDYMMKLKGEVFRNVPGRKTLRFQVAGKSYFAKLHYGVGWREIFKNLLSFKRPILSAITEVKAIQALNQIDIPTTPLVAYGKRGWNPAHIQSFVVTKDLGEIISLEDLISDWKMNPPTTKFKRKLIVAVAELAKKLHENGLNHRDFYICHLCMDTSSVDEETTIVAQIKLYLIDLHRMLIHKNPNARDNMKDIAALYFSSMDMGLNARDYLRFKHYYSKNFTSVNKSFWQKVTVRANKLYAKFHSDKFQQRLAVEKAALKK